MPIIFGAAVSYLFFFAYKNATLPFLVSSPLKDSCLVMDSVAS